MKSTPIRYQGDEAEDNSDGEMAQSSRPLRLALRKGILIIETTIAIVVITRVIISLSIMYCAY